MLLCQAYLGVVDLESRSGQDTGLDLAQSLADLVHGLVHYHDGGTRGSFQPAVLAISAAQHAVYQAPALSASTHSLVVYVSSGLSSPAPSASTHSLVVYVSCGLSTPCTTSKHSLTFCVCVMRSIKPLHHEQALIAHSFMGVCVIPQCTNICSDAAATLVVHDGIAV